MNFSKPADRKNIKMSHNRRVSLSSAAFILNAPAMCKSFKGYQRNVRLHSNRLILCVKSEASTDQHTGSAWNCNLVYVKYWPEDDLNVGRNSGHVV
jgi:hypothetical protein